MRAESVGRKIKTIRSKRLKERTCRVIENWVSQHKLFLSQHSFIVETDEWNTFCLLERSYSCWREGRGQSERAREREREVWMWSDVLWQFGIWNWKRGGIIVLIMEGREKIGKHNMDILFFLLLSTHLLTQSSFYVQTGDGDMVLHILRSV